MGDRRQYLEFKNIFLIHRWYLSDVPYIFYTEADIRRIHRGFEHPSVKSTESMLRSAVCGKLDEMVNRSMLRVQEACAT